MTRKEELFASYDAVGNRKWESLESALKDLTEEEALFQHPCYAKEEIDPAEPLPGSVMWHLVHLPHCYRHYVDIIRERPAQPADPPAPQPTSVIKAIQILQQERAELRATIAKLSEAELDEKLYYDETVTDLVRGTIRHDAWHGGQIVMARRLFRTRNSIQSPAS